MLKALSALRHAACNTTVEYGPHTVLMCTTIMVAHSSVRLDRLMLQLPCSKPIVPWCKCIMQAWGVMEYREGNLDRARELLQQGVWADPNSKDVAKVFHAWGVLEKSAGNVDLARELFRCAVKADPDSEPGWLVSCGCHSDKVQSQRFILLWHLRNDRVFADTCSSVADGARCVSRQSWALLEEDIGALGRAEELRSFRQQRRTEIVLPRTFADPDVVLAPVFSQIAVWFKHSEVRPCVCSPGCMVLPIAFSSLEGDLGGSGRLNADTCFAV